MTEDLIGADSRVAAEHPVAVRVAAFASEALGPNAAASDREGVSRAQLDALAETGAFGVQFPRQLGGSGAEQPVLREVVELIAGACGNTWFCFAQHRTPTGALLTSPNELLQSQWLHRLVAGEAIGSAAFAHLRRPKQSFGIQRAQDGWLLNGQLDWITTWPISDVALVQGFGHDFDGSPLDEVISVFVEPPRPDPASGPGIAAGPSLDLAAMRGTHTWPVRFEDHFVPDSQLVSRQSVHTWRVGNDRLSADANPASFGMARASINEMANLGERTLQPAVSEAAMKLARELGAVRSRSYALNDAARINAEVADASVGERTELRARALDLNVRAQNALITATGGGAMMMSAAGQRRARDAIFLLVQGQTAALRTASLGLASQD